jgi:DNA repair exonuclease SbcCD ATPase subunit
LLVNGTRVPLQVGGGRELSGSFVLEKPGSYRFIFFNSLQRQVAEGPPIPIAIEPDEAPKVTLLSPTEDIEIDPGQKVVLKYVASDDFGLTSLDLIYRTPRDSEDRRIELGLEDERRSKGEYRWDLSPLKLAPGERVSYYLAARDNDEVSGHKLGVSRTQYIKIYSASEHRRDAVRKAEALWERLVGHLASRLEGPDRAPEKQLEKVAAQSTLDQSGLELASEMLHASQELSRRRDSPEELWTALSNIGHGFQKRLRTTATYRRLFARTQMLHLDVDPPKRLAKAAEDEIAGAERDVLYLESLLDRQKLQDLRDIAKQLANDRRELASLVEQYKQTRDPKLQESILRQVQALKSRIGELMQRMSELAKGIRDEHLNQEALKNLLQERDMRSELDEIERLMREGKADEALAKLQEMAMQMDQMLKGLEESDGQFADSQYPELASKFQNFMEDLRQTTQEQKRLADQTKEVRDRYKAEARQRLAHKGQALKEQLMKEVEEIAKDYRQIGPEQLTPGGEKSLDDAQGELENLRNSLKVEDYDLAAEAAARAERSASELSAHVDQRRRADERYGNSPEQRAQSKQLAERAAKDAQRVQDINQKLQQLFPPPGSMISEGDRDKLKQFFGEQRQLQKKAQGLQQQMEDISQMAPVFGEDSSDQMEQIARRMGEASKRMEAKDPNRGYNEQKAALEQLQRFQQQMREAQSKGKGRRGLPLPMYVGSRGSGFGENASREQVQIPGPDQAPKEFRKDLLEAMKQGAPEKYKDQVKRYYEELVK